MDIKRDLQKCVHCGLCLTACPTYQITGKESESPRGRIYLIRSAFEGESAWDEVAPHIDSCLGCLACQTACPSGVHYSTLVEYARERIEDEARGPINRAARKGMLTSLSSSAQMKLMLKLGRLITPGTGDPRIPGLFSRLVSGSNAAVSMPSLPDDRYQPPAVSPAKGERRYRVALLMGCVMRLLYPNVHRATVRALTENGCEVVAPKEQGCCGALWLHNGYPEEARAAAKRNFAGFDDVDAVIVNAAGCGSTMKEYGLLFGGQAEEEAAKRAAGKVRDVSEFLVEIGFRSPETELDLAVGYHDACHLAHGQGITTAPRRLINSIPGVRLVEIADSDRCCGSAGIYNITQPEMASKLLDKKINSILEAGVEAIASANPGCSLWIAQGLRAAGRSVQVVHPVELLAKAYGE